MPAILASSVITTFLIMAALLLNRMHNTRKEDFKYPVRAESAPDDHATIIEDEAAVYDPARHKTEDLMLRFRSMMEDEKPFLNPELTIDALAGSLGTNKTTLSRVINDNFGMNFRQLINSYKVKEAIMIFSRNNNISMDDLRAAAGFKSNGTFTSSFTRFTGCTPGEYCRKIVDR